MEAACHSRATPSKWSAAAGSSEERGEKISMRRWFLLFAAVATTATLVAGFASSAGAYGGGATHDTWQVGMSFNCDNPTAPDCLDPISGQPSLGGILGLD